MAIDKRSAPRWVKIVIIVVAVSFVVSVGLPTIASLTSPSSTTSAQNGNASTNASDTLSAISKEFAPKTQAIEQQLSAKPNDPDLLKAQAQQYYGWAGSILAATNSIAEARPMAALAVQYYERAFAIKPGDSGDLTDYAAALFYSGNLQKATATAEGVIAKDPKFAAAYFNLGVFYAQANRTADAINAYQTAQKLDPKAFEGEDIAGRIADLQKSGASAGATGTP